MDAEARVLATLANVAAVNEPFGIALREWNDKLLVELPNPKSRLALVQRVARWLRSDAFPNLPSAVAALQTFFGTLSRESTLFERRETQRAIRRFLVDRGVEIPAVLKSKLKGKTDQLTRPELLTEAEVDVLINHARSTMHKALIAVLWDSGARIDEVLSLRIRDVRPHRAYDVLVVTVSRSKTYQRDVALFDATPWLRSWLNELGQQDPKGPLWLSSRGGALSEEGARDMLRTVADRAKADGTFDRMKDVYPHLFRHSRATRLVELGFNETKLKARLGWGLSTKQLARYIHLAQQADVDEDAKVHGVPVNKKVEKVGLAKIACPVCEAPNPAAAKFCNMCGQALKPEAEPRPGFKELLTKAYYSKAEGPVAPSFEEAKALGDLIQQQVREQVALELARLKRNRGSQQDAS